jgi:WD40 repeat protein
LSAGATVFEQSVKVATGEASVVSAHWSDRTAARRIPSIDLDGQEYAGHRARVTGVVASGDDRAVFSTGADGTLRVWDSATGAALRSVEAHEGVVQGLSLLSDGRALTVGDDMLVRVWDLLTGTELKAIATHANAKLTCSASSNDGRFTALGTAGGEVIVIDVETGAQRHRWSMGRLTSGGLAFSPDGRTLLVGLINVADQACPVRVYDMETGKLLRELLGHKAPVWGVAFLPDGRRAVTAGADRTLRLWDVTTGVELKRFEGHPGAVLSRAVSRDGRYVITGTGHQWAGGWSDAESYGAHVWDLEEGQVVGRLETSSPVRSVAFSGDGQRVLAGGEDRIVHWWSLPDAVKIARRTLPEAATVSRGGSRPYGKG